MSRFVDLLMSIPTLIFGLVVLSVLPTNLVTLILVMGILDSTRVYRLSRAVAVDINVMDFVEAAKLRGEGRVWIIFREILPNALSPLVSELGLRFIYRRAVPVDAVLPRPRRAAAGRRLGRHGQGKQGRHRLRHPGAL